MTEACGAGNVGQLASLARLLHSDIRLLEIVSLHTSIPNLVDDAVAYLAKLDFGSHSALSYLRLTFAFERVLFPER